MNAGYSGTPLPKKLGVHAEARVKIVRPLSGLQEELLPYISADEELDVVIAFCTTIEELVTAFDLRDRLKPAGGLWICWPKRKSGIPTELTEDKLREFGLPLGIVDNKVCAIDEQWSGLRFVWRKELRAKLLPAP